MLVTSTMHVDMHLDGNNTQIKTQRDMDMNTLSARRVSTRDRLENCRDL